MTLRYLSLGLGLLCLTLAEPLFAQPASSVGREKVQLDIRKKSVVKTVSSSSHRTHTAIYYQHQTKPMSRWVKEHRLPSGVNLNSSLFKEKSEPQFAVSRNHFFYPGVANEKMIAHRSKVAPQPKLVNLRVETTKRKRR